jgi:hypothetical protein
MQDYPDILAAAYGLLGESVEVVLPLRRRFVVIGGWSPLLRNASPIRHPGTHDVDLLFLEGRQAYYLKDVIEKLLEAGYLLSAKHPFQLLRELQVNGKPLIFNVDLLHPMETAEHPELFVDQLALPVRISRFEDETLMVKSVTLPIAGELFPLHQVLQQVECIMPDGRQRCVDVPLMDEVGTIVTKAGSVGIQKRTRDAFDIFLAMTQGDRSTTIGGLKQFVQERSDRAEALDALMKAVVNGTFARNTSKHLKEVVAAERFTEANVTQVVLEFLREAGISSEAPSARSAPRSATQ